MTSIAFVCATNNRQILNKNLMQSPMLTDGSHTVEIVHNAPSASAAYNLGLDRTTAEIVVFVHHDVYLPPGWDALLRQRIAEVEVIDPTWALLGPNGIAMDQLLYGPVWSSSIGFIAGRMPFEPIAVQSLDELLFVMRRGSGLIFDEGLEWFHMYGTDIVCEARDRGLNSYAVSLPLIHNDGYKGILGRDFCEAYHYIRRKWPRMLPIQTTVSKITRSARPLYKMQWRQWRNRTNRRHLAPPTALDPREYARLCGWTDLRPNLDSGAPDDPERKPVS